MKKIRILETIRQGQVGGGETHVYDLSVNLDKEKYTPVVLSFTPGPMVDMLLQKGIDTRVLHTEQAFNYKLWKEVEKLIKELDIDIVHAHGTRAMSNVFYAARKLNIPLIYTVHGWSFHLDQKPMVRKIRELSEKFLTGKATKTICVSKSNQNDGITRFNMKRSVVIYNAVNLEKFNPDKPFKNIREELNIAPEKTLIGYIVRITVQKDPVTMLKAMKIAVEKDKNIMLLMVGEGDLKEESKQIVKEMNLEENVIFQPFRSDIPDILNAIDIYCLPSLWEGFPIGIIEAMAMRKAIIATPVDGNTELVEDKKTGLLVPIQSPEKLAESILTLHNNREFAANMAKTGYEFVIQQFNINRMVREVESLYDSFV